ncbi:MAG: hypothetical protein ACYDH9_12000 [Limisphaerales bacterium]
MKKSRQRSRPTFSWQFWAALILTFSPRRRNSSRPSRNASDPSRPATTPSAFFHEPPLVLVTLIAALFGTARGADTAAATLQKGLFEEEASHNLDAAIQA